MRKDILRSGICQKNYEHTVYLNFFENPQFVSVFSGSLEVDHITMLLSALMGRAAVFEPGKTLLVLDEIQDCPDARTALKFFKLDGRYDVIGTGSLLGVKGYGEKEPKSVPVGYETVLDMTPLDFEEFLWANGITEPVIELLRQCMQSGSPVPDALHQRMRELLLQYTVVGGMPDAVQTFVDTKRMDEVLQIQRDIIRSYEDDMVKYADKKDKAVIRECFQSIPKQLSKENKKFQYSVVKKGATASKFAGSLQWIEDAGIITRCYNLSITELPLDGNADPDVFKVYMKDTGLFISMLEDGTQFDILQGNLLGYKGAIFEGLIAIFFLKWVASSTTFTKTPVWRLTLLSAIRENAPLWKSRLSPAIQKVQRPSCATRKSTMCTGSSSWVTIMWGTQSSF